MPALEVPPDRPVGAEDIRDLQVRALHGITLRGSGSLDRTHHLAQHLGGHLGVERCRLQFFVSKQYLDDADVFLLFEQVGGKTGAIIPPTELST